MVWGRDEYSVLAAATDLYANQLMTHGPALATWPAAGFHAVCLSATELASQRVVNSCHTCDGATCRSGPR